MALINVSELIGDEDFTQPKGVKVIRRKVEIVDHQPSITETELTLVGIITIANDNSINSRETADENTESIHIFTYELLLTTGLQSDDAVDDYMSDIVIWQGVKYRVMSCLDDTQYGFCRSTAEKLRQDVM